MVDKPTTRDEKTLDRADMVGKMTIVLFLQHYILSHRYILDKSKTAKKTENFEFIEKESNGEMLK